MSKTMSNFGGYEIVDLVARQQINEYENAMAEELAELAKNIATISTNLNRHTIDARNALSDLESEISNTITSLNNTLSGRINTISSTMNTGLGDLESRVNTMNATLSNSITSSLINAKKYTDDVSTQLSGRIDTLNNNLLSIPKFAIAPVTSLPTTNISSTTVYLLKGGDDSSNLYTEYIYVNGAWEKLGTQATNLDGYVVVDSLNREVANRLEADNALRELIQTEAENRGYAISNLSQGLNSELDALEVAIESLRRNLTTEIEVRGNNDNAFYQNITSLTASVTNLGNQVTEFNTKIPSKTSQLVNDSDFVTDAELDERLAGVSTGGTVDLTGYYKKTETYSRNEVNSLVSAIPKFSISVVTSLPTTNISETTVYLVKSGSDNSNLYLEYIYVNGAWEKLGVQNVDLSGYALKSEVSSVNDELNDIRTDLEDHTHSGEYIYPHAVELTGASTHGGFIDFHYNRSTEDYTTRLIENGPGELYILVGGVKYRVLTEYNKPRGTYEGDGATYRTITVGGSSEAMIIRGNDIFAIVSNAGAICKKAFESFVLNHNECMFVGGQLTLNTDKLDLNTTGVTYEYQVI